MRTAVIAAVVVCAACGPSERKHDDDDDDRYRFDFDLVQKGAQRERPDPGRFSQDSQQTPPMQQDLQPPPKPPAPPVRDACIAHGTVDKVRYAADKVYACTADACASWSKSTGKYLKTEAVFAVEADDHAADTPATVDPPDPEADDARVTSDGDAITACPEDRACLRFMPRLADGATVDAVRGDAKHRAVAVSISTSEVKDAHVEVWDLEAGRLRARVKYPALAEDQTYTFPVRAYGDAFVALAKRDDNARATGMVLGLDGTRRAVLANGSAWIDVDQLVDLGGTLAVLDMGEPGKPYSVYLHALPSGALVGKTTIPMIGSDDDVSLVKMERGMLGVAQWKSDGGTSSTSDAKLRVDILDPKAGSRVFVAPGC